METISKTEKERLLADAKSKGVQFVDLEFVDLLGMPKMCEITVDSLEEVLTHGTWFDGSSIEGFARISESDIISSSLTIWPMRDRSERGLVSKEKRGLVDNHPSSSSSGMMG